MKLKSLDFLCELNVVFCFLEFFVFGKLYGEGGLGSLRIYI